MTFKTSSKQWVVFSSALKRLKWLGILYGVVLFLSQPLRLWIQFANQKAIQGNLWPELVNKLPLQDMFFHPLVILGNIIASVIFGLILFHYLQKEGAGTFFHSLPIKRAGLYWQNLLAGLTLIWLPILINGLLTYGILGLFGISQGGWFSQYLNSSPYMEGMLGEGSLFIPIGQVFAFWLFLSLLMTGFFYIFTVFVGMFTGNVLLQGALTLVGLNLPFGLYMLVKFNLWRLLYGYPRDFDGNGVEKLSPLIYYLNTRNFGELFRGWHWYGAYLVVTLVLCGASIILYKVRAAEAAGETLAAGWIRQVFKYGVAACAALTGGLYFSTINENSTAIIYLGYVIGGVLGYAVSDMIAYKSFRFYERWKGLVVFGGVFLLIVFAVKLDFFSYVKYVPEQSEVKQVSLSILNNRYGGPQESGKLKEKDNIERVLKLHRQIINREQENKAELQLSRNPQKYSTAVRGGMPYNQVLNTDVTYTLNNGQQIKRSYSINASIYRELLYPLVTSTEAKRVMYQFLFQLKEDKIDQLNLNNYHLNKNIRIYKPEEVRGALEAMRQDVLNLSYEAIMEDKVPNRANIDFMLKTNQDRNYFYNNLPYYLEFKNLDAFLASHGYLDQLFVNPNEVAQIKVNKAEKAGNAEKAASVEITDKSKINFLLNVANLGTEKEFLDRQKQLPNEQFYSGKVVMNNGQTLFVIFDNNPNFEQNIAKMFPNTK